MININGKITKINEIKRIIAADNFGDINFLSFLSKGLKINAKTIAPKKALKKGKLAYTININKAKMIIPATSFLFFRYSINMKK